MPGKRVPRLCVHKGRGLNYVTDPGTGKEVYLGPAGSVEAAEAYGVWVREFLARDTLSPIPPVPSEPPLTVARLCLLYLRFARTYYRKRGKLTSESGTIANVLSLLNERSGAMPAAGYGPRDLKAFRDSMATDGYGRKHVNDQIHRVRRAWKWAVSEGLIPAACWDALRSVSGLAKGRSPAPEPVPVSPVHLETVLSTLPYLKPSYAALVLFQLWGCMRPGEAVVCRPRDVDRSGLPWEYRPWSHKGEHRERDRVVYLGPHARAALTPLLDRCPSPSSWVWASCGRGVSVGRGPGHLTEHGYQQAIEAAVIRANADRHAGPPLRPIPHWFPLQLRHSAATAVRSHGGIEAAQVMLGHAELTVSQVYAERNHALARKVAEEAG